MSNKNLIPKLLCFILCISLSSISEDIIYLKNGGKLRGKIIEKTETGVVIDIGFGEMDVDNSEIERILRGEKAEQEEWGVKVPKVEPEVKQEAPLKAEPKVAPKIDPKVEPKIEPEEKPEIEPEIWPEVEQEAEPKIEPKAEPEVEQKIEQKVEPEPKEEPEMEPEVEQEAEPEIEPKVEPEAEPAMVPKVEPEAEPEIEPKVEPKEEQKIEPRVEDKEDQKQRARRRSRRDKGKRRAERTYNLTQSTIMQYMSAKKGIFVIGNATLNEDLLAASAIPKNKFNIIPKSVEIGIYYPKQYSKGKKYPLLLVMGPGVEIGISEINSYVQFADELGFIIAAPELPPNADIEEARYYYILHIIEYLREVGTIENKPVWIGGVSGGGQWALQLGAYGGNIFDGIISIGRIEDFTIIADNELKNKSLLEVPICLLNKKDDNVADAGNDKYKETIASIKEVGFTRIKILEHWGEKIIPYKETLEAFKWLMSNAQ